MSLSSSSYFDYAAKLAKLLQDWDWERVAPLGQEFIRCWTEGRQVFLCGNGGSAGNAIHLANDYLYGIAKKSGAGLRVHALSANPAVITCLANDIGYDEIYAEQLAVLANAGDLLVVLSGSGNSPNILRVLERAKKMGITSCAILGFSGGSAKELADISLHFEINDMQIAEDIQLIIGHMLMQQLYAVRDKV